METRENSPTVGGQQERQNKLQEVWRKIHEELKLGHERLINVAEEMPLINEGEFQKALQEIREGKITFRHILATDEQMLAYVSNRMWNDFYKPVCDLINELDEKIEERGSSETVRGNVNQNSNQEIDQ